MDHSKILWKALYSQRPMSVSTSHLTLIKLISYSTVLVKFYDSCFEEYIIDA